VSLELGVLHFLHLEDIGAFWILQVLLHVILIVKFETFQPFSQLLFQLVRQRRQIFIVEDSPIVHLHHNTLNGFMLTSDSMVLSTIEGFMPTINGTGAAMYYLRVLGRIGISTCSHLKGNTNERKASMAKPRMVLDCDTKMIFFSSKMASNILIMHCSGKNLKTQ
jgi:hypothetical protein